jgi:hypothetical protein
MPRTYDIISTNTPSEASNPFGVPLDSGLRSAVDDLAACTSGVGEKVDNLGEAIREGVRTMERIVMPPLRLTIETVAPEPYDVRRPIPVVIRAVDDGFAASLFDANIHTEGETPQEAFDNLRTLILDTLELLSEQPAETLGPEPRRQLAVLREFIAPCSLSATAE